MTEVYAVNCETLCEDAVLQRVLPLLDEARRARVLRLCAPQKQAQCAAAGLLLRHLFGANTPIAYHGNGKPYLPDQPGVHFNLSHTGDWVLCVVSEVPVGIDAQTLSVCNPRIAARWFTEAERQWMREDPDVRFTRLWTRKEAYAKMTGEGIAKTLRADGMIDHEFREYADFANDGIYVTVCAAGHTVFAPSVERMTEPLW